ncbi:MAG: MurR/RpiR family transcriptional regulator [Deltaproteobacteria bacterium]|nr:MurR/RpiR family transcriptional regulator [Deltaproteobacteria bacterium]
MSFKELLARKQKDLTLAQRTVMKHIMEHYDEAIFLTASALARRADVSEATVVRLAQSLGLKGYPEMQQMLREDLQNRLSTTARLEQTVQRVTDEKDVLLKVLQEDIQNLSLTLQNMPVEMFQVAVGQIMKARNIYVIGLRGAHAPALILALYLRYLKKASRLLVPGYGDVWNTMHGITTDDLLIGISFPRYSRLTIEVVEYAHRQGAMVGSITDSVLSPLAEYSDWVLPAHCKLDSFIESFTASLSIANALVTAIGIQHPEETLKALRDREALWKEKGIYVMDEEHKRRRLP